MRTKKTLKYVSMSYGILVTLLMLLAVFLISASNYGKKKTYIRLLHGFGGSG
jgi:hypothetical protein